MAVTPNGKILNNEPYLDLVLARGLEKWNALPEEERRPGLKLDDLGPVDPSYDLAPPEGSVILQVYIRSLARDGKGVLVRPAKVDLGNPGAPPIDAQAQRDHFWISKAEAAAFRPEKPTAGFTYPVPASFARRIINFHLKDSSTCIPGTAIDLGRHAGTMTLTVLEASATGIRLRVDGTAKGGKADFAISGLLDLDAAGTSIARFDLVAFSETGHIDKATKAVAPLGIAFELLKPERPMDRIPPYFFTLERWGGSPASMMDAYFGGAK
jgi:hypothetical protein